MNNKLIKEKEFDKILQEVWELMPDDITTNDIFYSTQIEPHIIKALMKAKQELLNQLIKEVEKIQGTGSTNRIKIQILEILKSKLTF